MKLEFVINWGYQMLYSRRLYHKVYCWDGSLNCSDPNAVMDMELLTYPFVCFGICYNPEKTPVVGNSWQNVITRRAQGGLQVTAECADDAVFTLKNQYGEFTFTAEQIAGDGYLYFPVGGKYDFCVITIQRYGHYWFRPHNFLPGMVEFSAENMPLRVKDNRRMIMAELTPEQTLELPFEAHPAFQDKDNLLTVHIQGMLLKPDDTSKIPEESSDIAANPIFETLLSAKGQRNFISAEALIRLETDDGTVLEKKHFFRCHDLEVQLMEDIWFTFPIKKAIRKITVSQISQGYSLWIAKITCRQRQVQHLETELPQWALANEKVFGRIYAVESCDVTVSDGKTTFAKSLVPGWNEIAVVPQNPGVDYKFTVCSNGKTTSALIPAVYGLAAETPEVMVGCDFTTVPHDDNGDMDQILEYISRTRLGNTVVFRNFRPYPKASDPADELLERWGKYCADHRIFVQSVNCHASGKLAEAAGKYMHNGGWHEIAGTIYAADPDPENPAQTMPEAMKRYIAYVKADVDKNKQTSFRYGYGDAGGGARYLFQAGLEYIRAETMVPHTQHLCSLVRPASRIYGKGDWAVHIAVQHSAQPYIEPWHLGHYFLSLYQAWAMGANNIYEEDSLFITFKEEQQSWDDRLTKSKRKMTRDFMKFAATHPRKGNLRINIASLEGRFEAPFNGFVCGAEQDPSYSVWGKHGNPAPEWGHRQPEKKHQILDVLMPGASTHPLRQQEDKRRFYFSGTPYGDFDQLPVEAAAEEFSNYKLILNLGWHTANAEDQAKFEKFVADGGTYFAGITEYSCHTGRKFLLDMEELDLLNGGDLSKFAGIRVLGKGEKYSGSYAGISGDESSSRIYSFSPDEDGECCLAEVALCGAEVVVADKNSGKPLIVKNRFGKGIVYTLTAWAYPGHEELAGLMAAFCRQLCDENKGDYFIEDPSKEVFWNLREADTFRQMILLNTDWSTAGNVKEVSLHTPEFSIPLEVKEGEIKILYLCGGTVLETAGDMHLEFDPAGKITACGEGKTLLTIHRRGEKENREICFADSTAVTLEL